MKNRIYIAGAHSRARTLRAYLEYLYPDTEVVSYLVDNLSENASVIDGIPVCLINMEGLCKECRVYIGTRGENHPKITKELKQAGFTQIIPVTVDLDRQLRNEFVRRVYERRGKTFGMIDELRAEGRSHRKRTRIYVAGSALDKPLQTEYRLKEYETFIQVGAALTDRRISSAGIIDCTGENISDRNRQFCELTGLYWMWKNAREDILGLVHYRRHFLLPENWRDRMIENGVDVIVPVPLYVAPSLAENYKERHDPQVWNVMMQYLKEHDEQEHKEAEVFFQQNLYCPCNMFIMRRKILDRMCSWLFPVLFTVAERRGEAEDPYQNRYPGFLSERLITFFLEKNREKYKVVYADKNFLS